MVIRGGSRWKDEGQRDGWGLEEPSKRLASRQGWRIKICGSPPIRKSIYYYIKRKMRTKLLVVGLGKGLADRYFTNQTFGRPVTLTARGTCPERRKHA